uniref:Uncharacterized protein n=1 Tax=Cannabis sativa TaxID=3483 RepID=A0A803QDI2_CANSA
MGPSPKFQPDRSSDSGLVLSPASIPSGSKLVSQALHSFGLILGLGLGCVCSFVWFLSSSESRDLDTRLLVCLCALLLQIPSQDLIITATDSGLVLVQCPSVQFLRLGSGSRLGASMSQLGSGVLSLIP